MCSLRPLTDEDDPDGPRLLQPAGLGGEHAVPAQGQGDVSAQLLAVLHGPTRRVGGRPDDAALHLGTASVCVGVCETEHKEGTRERKRTKREEKEGERERRENTHILSTTQADTTPKVT